MALFIECRTNWMMNSINILNSGRISDGTFCDWKRGYITFYDMCIHLSAELWIEIIFHFEIVFAIRILLLFILNFIHVSKTYFHIISTKKIHFNSDLALNQQHVLIKQYRNGQNVVCGHSLWCWSVYSIGNANN